jgi:GTPase Era involved in 16S rRNA processing
MTSQPLRITVVGHTNAGKTSLMRTLMREVDFGEVSDRPAVTREVEAALLRAGDEPAIELFDTPGLEDSIGLLEHLDAVAGDRRTDGVDRIDRFLDSDCARARFAQEAKAIRQVLRSDAALYVIDARDRVHGKHRDELTILGMCARPVVPVLNFTADPEAKTDVWREHLARVNMHAVAEFDTVVFSARDERILLEKMCSLLDSHRALIDSLIADREAQRAVLIRSSSMLIADLLIDAAAYRIETPRRSQREMREAVEALRDAIRQREQVCVEQLVALHRFRTDEVDATDLPIENGRWGLDLFSAEAMRQFSTAAGGAAAAGAMVGLTLDIMLAGLSLGTGAATGAAVGGLLGAAHTHGHGVIQRLRGRTELRCDDATLGRLAVRQLMLVAALLHRGHAAIDRLRLDEDASAKPPEPPRIGRILRKARRHPRWSAIRSPSPAAGVDGDPARQQALESIAEAVETVLRAARDEPAERRA